MGVPVLFQGSCVKKGWNSIGRCISDTDRSKDSPGKRGHTNISTRWRLHRYRRLLETDNAET